MNAPTSALADGPATPRVNALPPWQRRTLITTGFALLGSGLAWGAVHLLWGLGELPHPAEAWLLRLHALAAMAGFFTAGVLAAGHVGRGWRAGRRRPGGLSAVVLGSFALATGFYLAHVAGEGARTALTWAHAAMGMSAFAAGALHRR